MPGPRFYGLALRAAAWAGRDAVSEDPTALAMHYTVDVDGNRTSETRYDSQFGALTDVRTFDRFGNMLTEQLVVDAAGHQHGTASTWTFDHFDRELTETVTIPDFQHGGWWGCARRAVRLRCA